MITATELHLICHDCTFVMTEKCSKDYITFDYNEISPIISPNNLKVTEIYFDCGICAKVKFNRGFFRGLPAFKKAVNERMDNK